MTTNLNDCTQPFWFAPPEFSFEHSGRTPTVSGDSAQSGYQAVDPNRIVPSPLSTPRLLAAASSSSSDPTSPATSSSSSSTTWRCHLTPKHRTCSKSFDDPASVGRHIGTVHMKTLLSPMATKSEQHAWLDNCNVFHASHRTTALTWFKKNTTCTSCRNTFGRPIALQKHKCKGPPPLLPKSQVSGPSQPIRNPPLPPQPHSPHPLPAPSNPSPIRSRSRGRRFTSGSCRVSTEHFLDTDSFFTSVAPSDADPLWVPNDLLTNGMPDPWVDCSVSPFMTSNIPIVFPSHLRQSFIGSYNSYAPPFMPAIPPQM